MVIQLYAYLNLELSLIGVCWEDLIIRPAVNILQYTEKICINNCI